MPVGPPAHVLDLFAVPDVVVPLPGGTTGERGGSVRAGDLVLSPDRDAEVAVWLNPVLARLAVELDERSRAGAPLRAVRAGGSVGVRVAMPIPARNGEWVVEGWGASRWEPGTTVCDDPGVLRATARLLHAELDVAVRSRPAGLDLRDDRWARAERLAFGPDDALVAAVAGTEVETEVRRLAAERGDEPIGPDQLVHADVAGNVLLDAAGAPVVIDVAPAWRPALWAEAVCVLDAVSAMGADPAELDRFTTGPERAALARAVLFRMLSDPPEVRRRRCWERPLEVLGA